MIKNIWIEIRPALKCCHFYVLLSEHINYEVKVKIKKSSAAFDLNGSSFMVNFKEFTVEPLTMTGLNIRKQCLSFRIQAECDFKFEKHAPIKSDPPAFGEGKSSLLCQCHNPLTSEMAFERILPLPSSDLSFSDMFCHFPTNLESPTAVPRIKDCFYSDSFLVINEENLTNLVKKGKFWKCKRCLSAVGISNKNSVKFWISCIKLPFYNLTLLEHFKCLVQKAVSNPVIMFPKILLECEENQTYLSLVIVDKNLIVSSCQENLLLKSTEVVKLKYKFHSSYDSDVQLLKEDPFHSLHQVQVPKSMMDFSTKYLISCSKTIPSIFSKVGNESMAYLNL